MGGLLLFWGAPYLIDKKNIEINGKKSRPFSILLALISIIIATIAIYSSILDCVFSDFPEQNITVMGINNPGLKSIIQNDIVSGNGIYTNLYHRFDFKIGKSYKITYLKRTKVILHAAELN